MPVRYTGILPDLFRENQSVVATGRMRGKVFVAEGGVARGRTVVLGRIRDGVQEIVEGLKAGDKVVVSGQSKLSDGMAVEVQSDQSNRNEAR